MDSNIERGKITYRQRAMQQRDYSGLRYGNITPTDVDGLIEYQNKMYVVLEVKYENAEMPYGQKLALERLCDDLQRTKPTLLIVARHETHDPHKDIDVANCPVDSYRHKGEWHKWDGNVRNLVDMFVAGASQRQGLFA